jgi:hypothetical protein
MKICILIPTYKRNDSLFQLLSQINKIINDYVGPNSYKVIVTDSDVKNPQESLITSSCDQYIKNKGLGFDDNLLFFYHDNAHLYDYIFSISDDDLFGFQKINPLYIVDSSLKDNPEAVLFNHINFESKNGLIFLKNKHYSSLDLSINDDFLFTYFLKLLPRHAGLIYSSKLIFNYLETLSQYRGTLHLYALPLLMAAKLKKVNYIDFPLVYFKSEPSVSGAWENAEAVFFGLIKFLINLKILLNDAEYEAAKNGFIENYIGDDSWLRRDLVARGCVLPPASELFDNN